MKRKLLCLAVLGTSLLMVGCDKNPSSVISSTTNPPISSTDPVRQYITVAEALDIGSKVAGDESTERYNLKVTIEQITNALYGAMIVKDSTGSISVFRLDNADGTKNYSEMDVTARPVAGDEIEISCTLHAFQGVGEIKNARLLSYKHVEKPIDLTKYEEMTIAKARTQEKAKLLQIEGVVARITYASGKIPNGFFLIDSTGSIYVYDSALAPQVKEGNKIKIAAQKDYWILDTEVSSAEKFGYKGCNQVTDAYLVSNDNKTSNAYDTSWVTEKTVKQLMETPFTEDITSNIYKVNAQVVKAVGTGYTNYYFNDIDGKTGTYTYTMNSGGDFTWLDEFDGKICTVYLSVLNAKSTATGCIWRVVPISVKDDNYTFDTAKVPQFVMDYYADGQIKTEYTGDPVLEVITSVSSTLLGFENATISYVSDNTDVVNFVTDGEKTYMHTGITGTANVTITASYETATPVSKTIAVKVDAPVVVESITVKESIETAVGEEVTVRGIVGPSVINQKSGFYLIDETGAIAVRMSSVDVLKQMEPGQEVVIKGTRYLQKKDPTKEEFGQSCIDGAEIVANYYGKHEYPTTSFVTGKTLKEVYDIAQEVTVDHSANVYKIENVQLSVKKSSFSTNASVTAGDVTISLYSGGSEYAWLAEYDGQTVTVELALCNWNLKTFYKGCVLSVTDANGEKTLNNYNFN